MDGNILDKFDFDSLSQEEIDQLLGKISMLNIPDSLDEEEGEYEDRPIRSRGRPRIKPLKVKEEGRGPGRPRTKPLPEPGEKRPVGRPKTKLDLEPREKRSVGRPKLKSGIKPVLIIRLPTSYSQDNKDYHLDSLKQIVTGSPLIEDYHVLAFTDATVESVQVDCYTVHSAEVITQEKLIQILNTLAIP